MLDSPSTCHKHGFLMGYKHVVCNTARRCGVQFLTEALFSYMLATFSILKNSNFISYLTCYRDACRYIKKAWIVDNPINAHYGLFVVHLCGFAMVNVG